MRKRKVFIVLELDDDETASILPPHLRGLLSRPLVEPIQTRAAAGQPWFPTEEQQRAKRRARLSKKPEAK